MTLPAMLLIHGAANGAWVWQFWRRELRELGWDVNVLDLRGHGQSLPVDFSTVTMEDYVWDVESVMSQIKARQGKTPILAGWSMGGLVAMMYAAKHQDVPALVLFEPSAPVQVAGRASPEDIRATPNTAMGPETYGVYPDDPQRSRTVMRDLSDAEIATVLENSADAQESGFARRQRQRGISIAFGVLPAPSLVVYGEQADVLPQRTTRLALYLGADTLAIPDASHWGLVMSERTVQDLAPKVDAWLRKLFAADA